MTKSLRQIFLLVILVTLFSHCDEKEENYSIEPHIEFAKIEFVESLNNRADTLTLIFSFTDGDSDLGLDNSALEYVSYPYNYSFFFQENNGSLNKLHTIKVGSSFTTQYDIIEIPDPTKGKLIFPRTRKKSDYENLPAYNCTDYVYLYDYKLLIEETDAAVLDGLVEIFGKISLGSKKYLQIRDTLLTSINPDHFNITVDFFVKNGFDFEVFDFEKLFCSQSFDGRFPLVCTQKCGPVKNGPFAIKMFSDKRGEITYKMSSYGLMSLFQNKAMKLRVTIRDRALHISNTIETPEFRLEDI